jgi:hypothetical protein
MIRLRIPALLLLLTFCANSFSQQEEVDTRYRGTVSGRIYSNFNYGLNSPSRATAFELTRAYFGYEMQISEHFSAEVKLDVGSPDDLSEFSRLRRYAYFKNAGVTYRNGAWTAWGGLFDMLQFKVQEKFWGYRYLYKSYMDEYRFGPSADLGAGAGYRFSNNIETDLVISNGEGYSSPQRDDSYKIGWGLTMHPTKSLTLRTYYAVFTETTPQMTCSGFAGYRNGNFRMAGEYNYQRNYQSNKGRNRYGYSVYSTYAFSDRWEIFLRYDQVFSNILPENDIPWNLPNDGSAMIGGLQYTPVRNIHITLDYQDWVEYAGNGAKEQLIYVHLEADF